MRVHALLLASLLTTPALAKNVAVLPFTGSGASNARGQLLDVLCEELECIPQSKVTKGKNPDWAKAKKHKVHLFVAGKVSGSSSKQKLELSFFERPGKTKFKKSYPVSRGKLSSKNLSSARALVFKMAGHKESSDEEVEDEPPPAVAKAKPVEAEEEEADREDEEARDSEDKEERIARRGEEVSRNVDDEPAPDLVTNAMLVVEAGPDMFSRSLTYSQVQTPNLRSYAANLIFAPRIHAEFFPLASSDGLMSGLGVEGNFAMALGLSSKRSDGPSHPTSMSRLEVAAKFKWRPLDGSLAAVIPTVGYRSSSFAVGKASDGSVLEGLPGVSYSAVLLGVGGELPFASGRVVAFGRFAYLPVLSSGEILSRAYFPRGSASGLDVRLGVGFRVMPNLEARLTGQLSRYGMEFKTEAGDPYIAANAVDQYLGGNLSIRYLYDG